MDKKERDGIAQWTLLVQGDGSIGYIGADADPKGERLTAKAPKGSKPGLLGYIIGWAAHASRLGEVAETLAGKVDILRSFSPKAALKRAKDANGLTLSDRTGAVAYVLEPGQSTSGRPAILISPEATLEQTVAGLLWGLVSLLHPPLPRPTGKGGTTLVKFHSNWTQAANKLGVTRGFALLDEARPFVDHLLKTVILPEDRFGGLWTAPKQKARQTDVVLTMATDDGPAAEETFTLKLRGSRKAAEWAKALGEHYKDGRAVVYIKVTEYKPKTEAEKLADKAKAEAAKLEARAQKTESKAKALRSKARAIRRPKTGAEVIDAVTAPVAQEPEAPVIEAPIAEAVGQ